LAKKPTALASCVVTAILALRCVLDVHALRLRVLRLAILPARDGFTTTALVSCVVTAILALRCVLMGTSKNLASLVFRLSKFFS